MGSIEYCAPEQIRRDEVDGRALLGRAGLEWTISAER
jgi:hypothetical protein